MVSNLIRLNVAYKNHRGTFYYIDQYENSYAVFEITDSPDRVLFKVDRKDVKGFKNLLGGVRFYKKVFDLNHAKAIMEAKSFEKATAKLNKKIKLS